MLFPQSHGFWPAAAPRTRNAADALHSYLAHAQAPNTWRTYQSQWRVFAAWCEAQGCPALPAQPETVATYLAQRARAGTSTASLSVTLAALRFVHTIAGHAAVLDSPMLSLVIKGIRRQHVRPQRQAEPLTGALLREILSGRPETIHDLRDGALLALLYVFGLRAAEVVALDWQEAGQGGGWLVVQQDCAEVVLLGSKASPCQAERLVVPLSDNPLAMAAIQRWIDHAPIMTGRALLRPLTRGGGVGVNRLGSASVSSIVKFAMARHFRRVGLSPAAAEAQAALFSGHSGRVGMCVTATEAGVPHQYLAALVRHRSLAMVRRYAERADRIKCAPHRAPGVGV
jgi:site-specific recombinase XerD